MSEHILEHLSAYLDGELSAAERERFRAHLAECASCSNRLAELVATDARLRDLPVAAPEGYFEGLPARVRGRLSASARPRRALSVPVWTLAAAAALVVGVLAPLTLRERRAAPAAEADKLARVLSKDEGQGAAPLPAATAAPGESDQKRAEPKPGALAKAKGDVPASRPARAPAAEPPRQETAASEASGFAAPPRPAATATQEFGPRASQQADLRKQGPAKQGADAQTETPALEGRVAARALEAKDAAAPMERDSAASRKDAMSERTAGLAAASRPLASAKLRELQARTPRDAAEARSLRESWRRFSSESADPHEADEARVRVVEMGVAAWRFEQQPADRSLAEQDAAAYLARADARQPDRVRGLLAAFSR